MTKLKQNPETQSPGEFKGTKGEWVLDSDSNLDYIAIKISSNLPICKLSNVPPKEETIANAKLIAAAPELLEALQNLLADSIGEFMNSTHGDGNMENVKVFADAHNAIKKATS